MHGFKSFAEQSTIEFDTGITCVVGPNGCGKSNISDAIRWVLGEQSPKTLRGKSMDQVIFAGTESRKPRGMAEVVITIDNTSKILPIEFEEVAISRKMYRSGESEYAINGNLCRLKDIKTLLMDTGIGVEGYSIIGQGHIAEIIDNKPVNRRAIFEEVAGIVKYRVKKTETERKLDQTNLNIDRVNDIIKEIEGRIHGLKTDSEKAVTYLEIKKALKDLEINIALKTVENIEVKNKSLEEELKALEVDLKQIQEKRTDTEKEIEEIKEKNKVALEEEETKVEQLKSLEKDIHQLESQRELTLEKDKNANYEISRLNQEIEAVKEKLSHEKEAIKAQEQTIKDLSEKQAIQLKLLEEKRTVYEEKKNQISHAFDVFEAQKNQVFDLQSALSGKTAEKNSYAALKETLERRKLRISPEKEGYEIQLKLANEAILEVETTLENSETSSQTLEKDKNNLQDKIKRLEEKQTKELSELADIKGKLNQLETTKNLLEDMEQSMEGYSHPVKVLMQHKEEIPGIEGVVGDLIQVPKKYETALEIALGYAMQNIICQDEKTAKKAIDFLKQHRAGRGTFLPLNKVQGRKDANNMKAYENMQGIYGLAVDCIEFNPKYEGVFNHLLGNVLIVEDLNRGIEISNRVKSRNRIVTLEGDVINPTGAMTGGSLKTKQTNVLSRKSQIKEVTGQLAQRIQAKNKAEQNLEALKKELESNELDYKTALHNHQQATLDCLNHGNALNGLKEQIKGIEVNLDRCNEELSQIHEEEAKIESSIKAIEDERLNLQNKKEKVELGSEDDYQTMATDREALEHLEKEVTDLKMAHQSTESEMTHSEKMLDQIFRYVSQYEKEIESKEGAIETIRSRQKEGLSSKSTVETELTQKMEEKTLLEEAIAVLHQGTKSVVGLLESYDKEKESLDEKTYQIQSKKHEIDLKIVKNQTTAETYKDKLWEEFEVSYIQAMSFKKEDFVMSTAQKASREMKNQIKDLGDVNVGAIKEYAEVKERYDFLTTQRDDLLEAMSALDNIIEDINKTIRIAFKETFEQVSKNFSEILSQLFNGGNGQLILENPDDILETGVEIVVQPPGKKVKAISLLSGGEKAVAAMALMYAILKVKPTPFSILDEVEAAMDDSNIIRMLDFLRSLDDVQFVLITHQKVTMEYADTLYGITMPEKGISKIISLKMNEA